MQGVPVHPETAETLIFRYLILRYKLFCGEICKITAAFNEQARLMGLSPRTGWRLIQRAREIGMIDEERIFGT